MITTLVLEHPDADGQVVETLQRDHPEWNVILAAAPEDVVPQLETECVALLLADLNVPAVRNGQLLKQVRQAQPDLPVIVMTSRSADAAVVQALRLGAASFIPRGEVSRDLAGTAERVLALRGVRVRDARLLAFHVQSSCSFALGNERELIGPLVGLLQDEVTRYGSCDTDERARIGTALQEALANAIVHGNLEVQSALRERDPALYEEQIRQRRQQPPYADRRVCVEAEFRDEQARFVIRDEGPGFDITSVPDPLDETNLLNVTGRGLLLIKAFMDEVHFNARGNEITLVKRIHRVPADDDGACRDA